MAFDDVNIDTPIARLIWWNAIASFLMGLVECVMRAAFVFEHPDDVHMAVGRGGLVLHPNGFFIFMAAVWPFLYYLPGLYAYRSRGYPSRVYAALLGIVVLIKSILIPALQAEVVMKQSHVSDVFWYIALSQLLYGLFGKCRQEW